MQRRRSTRFSAPLVLGLGLVAFGLDAMRLWAAVVVVANQSQQAVTCSLAPVWGQTKPYALAPGKLIAVQVSDSVQLSYVSGKKTVQRPIEPNTVHYFFTQPDGLTLKRMDFSGSPGSPWLHRDQEGGPPPPAVVPVKLLVDDEQPAVRAKWEAEIRQELAVASQFLALYCNVRFEVVAVDTWESDDSQKDYGKLQEDFRQKVNPEPGWLALGFTSQYRVEDPAPLRHVRREPLVTHLLLPDVQPKLSKGDHLELLVHELGHYLGGAHSPDPNSVMRTDLKDKDADHRRVGTTIIDPVNTLVMNLVGEEIRLRQTRDLASVPRSTRQYLDAIYGEMARSLPKDGDVARYASMVEEPVVKPLRYRGRWTDGALLVGEAVGPWHETKASPVLAGRALFDAAHPIRWLVDETLPPAETPRARVEFVGGDCLPGRVIAFRTGTEEPMHRLPPHLLVASHVPLDWPDEPQRAALRVTTEWVRRIVWTPVAAGYQPQTLFYHDGRELRFRALRFGDASLKLLTDEGVREVPLDEVAEIHFPAQDPWEAYFQQLVALAPEGTSRLVQLETTDGLRLTGSDERFQARARGNDPYHLFQPAWSLDVFWVPHGAIRLRRFFPPHEVPLSRIEPAVVRQESDLGGVWPWQANRNCEGQPMETGGQPAPWGFGVHARCELEFALPALARWFRTRFGLDRLAGDGGCVQAGVFLRASGVRPLFASPLILGSTDVFETGTLALGEASAGKPCRLVLVVDPVVERRPSGADPLDIRDHFNWLEPLVTLDVEALPSELRRRAAPRIPAWEGWQVACNDRPEIRLVNRWDESDREQRTYRLLAAVQEAPLRLTRRLNVTTERYRLLIAVSRPPDTTPSKLEVLVDGQSVTQFEVPLRHGKEAPKPLVAQLSDFAGREVTVELVLRGNDQRSLTEWRALTLTGQEETASARGGTGASARASDRRLAASLVDGPGRLTDS